MTKRISPSSQLQAPLADIDDFARIIFA